jgi:hypothetical protein
MILCSYDNFEWRLSEISFAQTELRFKMCWVLLIQSQGTENCSQNFRNFLEQAKTCGIPVISIDAKKKENIGNFKTNGKTYQPQGNPIKVLDHDFPLKELGKVTPFGVDNIFKNQGFVNVSIGCGTAVFAVESIRKWRYAQGKTSIIQPMKSSSLRIAAAATVTGTDFGNTNFKS